MTLRVIHGGDGYTYLTRTVAAGDGRQAARQDLSEFYRASGTPPGAWFGRGAEVMGVAGSVTTAQMQALFGAGVHPDAEAMIEAATRAGTAIPDAIAATRLGSPFYALGRGKTAISELHQHRLSAFRAAEGRAPTRHEWAAMRRQAARDHLRTAGGGDPSPREVQKALGDERRRMRKPVSAFDCVFAAPGSVSKALFGLGSPRVRNLVWQCHVDAVRETLSFAEPLYAVARRGRGGVRQIDTDGWTVALFDHWDNRAADPHLHTHAVISTRVRGADGRWSCLDARALHQAAVSLSCRYNAILVGKLSRRLGVRFEERSRGRGKKPVLEVAGVPQELIALFSRRDAIAAHAEKLVLDYRRRHGRSPSKAVQIQLTGQAALATRGGKPGPRTLAEMLSEWDELASAWLASTGDHRSGREFIADLLDSSTGPIAGHLFRARAAAVAAGVRVGVGAVLAGDRAALSAAVDAELSRYAFDTAPTRARARADVLALLDLKHPATVVEEVRRGCVALARTRFEPDAIASEVAQVVAARRSTWTETHIRAAVEERVAICVFDGDAAQRAAVEQVVALVRDQHSVCLSVDPDPVPKSLQRRNGESVFNGPASTTIRYTSEAVLAAEAHLQSAAHQPSASVLPRADVTAAIATVEQAASEQGRGARLTVGQHRFVEHLCTSGTRLAAAIGPAGAGKTTALEAVVRAWTDSGRAVIALSPQKVGARELARGIRIPANTIASLLWAHRLGTAAPIPAGTMILIDEAGMASTADLVAVQQLADDAGAVVRWAGDPWQLSAVEAGGALRLVATDTQAPELDTVVRFADPAEAAASLHVRNGDPSQAWEFYHDNDRVRSGLAVELREQMLTAHLADLDAGLSSLMMAATIDDVFHLNGAAQAVHTQRGTVAHGGPAARLSDGHLGYVGDVIVTRRNTGRIRVLGGSRDGSPVTNGDRWRVLTVHRDGSLTAVSTDHRGRVHLPTQYVREDVQLGYACTVHRAQGVTVDRAHLLMGTSLGRALAYVGLSRGRLWNGLYVATDRLPDPPPLEHAPDEPASDRAVFHQILARDDDNISATEVMRAELSRLEDPSRLREIYAEACRLLGRGRALWLLDRALPAVLFHQVCAGGAFESLCDTLTVADQIGMDLVALITDITTNGGRDAGETLITARDAAAVLSVRADRSIAAHLENNTTTAHFGIAAGPDGAGAPELGRFRAVRDVEFTDVAPVPSRHPGVDIELAEFALRLFARLTGSDPLSVFEDPITTTPDVDLDSTEVDAGTSPIDQMARFRVEYDGYARQLAHDHARYLLDTAVEHAVLARVQAGRGWMRLLDTIAFTAWLGHDSAVLVEAITDGDTTFLLRAHDAAAVLCARADSWIAEHTPTVAEAAMATRSAAGSGSAAGDGQRSSRFRAVRDLPSPAGLRPLPPEHPGMDTAVADWADELYRRILDLPEYAPDWRARTTTFPTDPTDSDDDSHPSDALPDSDTDDWITTRVPDGLPYPELPSAERLARIRAELAAAEELAALLTATVFDHTSPHALAMTEIVAGARTRADRIAGLLHEVRDTAEDADAAEDAARAAQHTYHQALRQRREPADDQWLTTMTSIVEAVADPEVRAQMDARLSAYRAAAADTAAARVAADIDAAQLLADAARRWANQLRDAAENAQRALITAAGQHLALESRDIDNLRQFGTELALADLAAVREHRHRLRSHLMTARRAAIEELIAATGLDPAAAAAQVDRSQPTRADIDAALPTAVGRGHRPTHTAAPIDLVNAAVAAARRRLIEIVDVADAIEDGDPDAHLGPITDDAVTQLIRARADALLPTALAAYAAENASKSAEAQAITAENAHQLLAVQEPDPWVVDDPFVAEMKAKLAALPPDSPLRDQVSTLLDQYQLAAIDTEQTRLGIDRDAARDAAAEARAHAEELRSDALAARRALDARVEEINRDSTAAEITDTVSSTPAAAHPVQPSGSVIEPVEVVPDRSVAPDTEDEARGGEGEDTEGWICVADARTDQLYPDLDPIERVVRITSDLSAAQDRVIELHAALKEERSEHHLAIAAQVRACRERVDELRPLLLAYRDAHQRSEDAAIEAAAAEDTYRQALAAQPEQADEAFLAFLHDKTMACIHDPGMGTRLTDLLDRYRDAVNARAVTSVDADIAQARLLADDARAWAEQLQTETDAARTLLDEAAGDEGVVEESDLHRLRLLADELAIDALNTARSTLRRLPPYLHRARMLAATELCASAGLEWHAALTEVDLLAAAVAASVTEELRATEDLPAADPAPGEGTENAEGELAARMRDDPIQLHSDTDLATLMRALRHTAGHADPALAEPGPSRTDQVRDIHARLTRQVNAIHTAQEAMAAAEEQRGDERARRTATAAIAAAAALGAPRHRWATLLTRADNPATLAAELAAAQQADHRDRARRKRAEQRAARAAHDLTAAARELRRRTALSSPSAATEQRIRATHHAPALTTAVDQDTSTTVTNSSDAEIGL
ncbi:MobF family relaxase (plasmid) [Nocardia sp. CA-084685]|uniref:MobF family relaxase n=1 Tax=Nocardia sp. CA-084685 TaxID=3239970 RepID=UPI003D97FF25